MKYWSNSSQCSTHHPVRRVEAECQGREHCSLTVSSQTLMADSEDPCPHTARQLTVSHQCRPDSLRTRLTCPSNLLRLSCSPALSVFVMLSSASQDRETLLHYCGPHSLNSGLSSTSSNSSLTRLVVEACHGLSDCQLELPSTNLVRTVYSCVSQGVINMELLQRYKSSRSSTTTTTTSTTTTTTTTTATTITTTETPITTTRTTSIDFTSFKTFTKEKENKKVNESLQNDQIQHQVRGSISPWKVKLFITKHKFIKITERLNY